jgi:hypothetical protein
MALTMEKLKSLWKQKYPRCLFSLNPEKLLLFLTRNLNPMLACYGHRLTKKGLEAVEQRLIHNG